MAAPWALKALHSAAHNFLPSSAAIAAFPSEFRWR